MVTRFVLALASAAIGVLIAIAPAHSQTLSRSAVSVDALLRYPGFFHSKAISLVASVAASQDAEEMLRVPVPAGRTLVIVPRVGRPPDRPQEFRGTLVDLGRFAADDSRFPNLSLEALARSLRERRWPERDTFLVLTQASWVEPPGPREPSLRSVVLTPAAFEGRSVTLRGRFRAKNLFGDLPASPKVSQWDFVIQSADAALWVTGLRPRGKGFELNPGTRQHTNQWVEVTGQVQVEADLPRLVATSIALARAEEELPLADSAAPVSLAAPPAVVFSAPTNGETDISPAVTVRIQFSRDMRAASFEKRVAVAYGPSPTSPVPAFTATYRPGLIALEIRFASPLARLTEVVVTLGDGIAASDGAPMAPITIRFTTGG